MLETWRWVGESVGGLVEVQCSAHGVVEPARVDTTNMKVHWQAAHRLIAPGQSIVAFVDDVVVGGGIAGR